MINSVIYGTLPCKQPVQIRLPSHGVVAAVPEGQPAVITFRDARPQELQRWCDAMHPATAVEDAGSVTAHLIRQAPLPRTRWFSGLTSAQPMKSVAVAMRQRAQFRKSAGSPVT